MNSVSIVFILIGLFVIINAPNFVGVFNGDKKINLNLNSATPVPANSTGSKATSASGN